MKASITSFLIEILVTGLGMRSIVLFLRPINPSLKLGSYKRTVYAQVSVAFRFPFTYLCLHLDIHNFLLFRYNSFFLKTIAYLPISVTGTHSMSFSLTIRRIVPEVRSILAIPAFYIYGFRFDFLCHTVSIFTASSSPDSARRFNSLYKVKEEYPSGGINFLFSISSCTLFRFIASSS